MRRVPLWVIQGPHPGRQSRIIDTFEENMGHMSKKRLLRVLPAICLLIKPIMGR